MLFFSSPDFFTAAAIARSAADRLVAMLAELCYNFARTSQPVAGSQTDIFACDVDSVVRHG
jgi:hypothetical protein